MVAQWAFPDSIRHQKGLSMPYTTVAKASRQTKTRDDLNSGSLRLRNSSGTTLASVTLDAVCGAIAGAGVLTFSGFPKSASGLAGTVADAAYYTSAGALYRTATIGIPGSGAAVIIDVRDSGGSSTGTLVIPSGGSVTFSAAPSLTHA
jgi:hypothetical protein